MRNGINKILVAVRKMGILKFSARYCDIGDECAESVVELFGEDSIVTDIDLTGNHLKDPTISLISKQFRMNNTLKSFSIASNGINQHYVTSIIPEVQAELTRDEFVGIGDFIWTCHDNTSLTYLNLRGNHFGEEVAKQVEEMLSKRKSLGFPIICLVTERISEGLFERIAVLNGGMGEKAKKKSGKKGGKKGKK
jgi:Ran GTPase-activating protein (RanGAP) involved in mRNA processing and transport